MKWNRSAIPHSERLRELDSNFWEGSLSEVSTVDQTYMSELMKLQEA